MPATAERLTMAKPLMAGLAYPYDWGFIPSTKAEDGDPLDVLILHDAKTYPGVVLRCKPIGILEVEQSSRAKRRGMIAYLQYRTAPLSKPIYRTSKIFHRGRATKWSCSFAPQTRWRISSSVSSDGSPRPRRGRAP